MDKVVEVALKKAKSDVKLDPGTYKVDATVRITGFLKVGESYEQKIVAKADPWTLLAISLSKLNGVTVESLVKEATNGGFDTEDIKNRANEAIAAVKAPTITECAGKVTGQIEFFQVK